MDFEKTNLLCCYSRKLRCCFETSIHDKFATGSLRNSSDFYRNCNGNFPVKPKLNSKHNSFWWIRLTSSKLREPPSYSNFLMRWRRFLKLLLNARFRHRLRCNTTEGFVLWSVIRLVEEMMRDMRIFFFFWTCMCLLESRFVFTFEMEWSSCLERW